MNKLNIAAVALLSCVLVPLAVHAQFKQFPPIGVTLETARASLQAGITKCATAFPTESFAFCIVDQAGRMRAFARLDETSIIIGGHAGVACSKAKGVLQLGLDTATVSGFNLDRPGPNGIGLHWELTNIANSPNNYWTEVPGGFPLKDGTGMIVGAIGVSGSHNASHDAECAQAAVTAVANGQQLMVNQTMVIPAGPATRVRDSLSLKEAMMRVELMMTKAYSMQLTQGVSVVDIYGNLVAFHSMDGLINIAYDLAYRKARSAVLFNMNNQQLRPYMINVTNPYFTLDFTNDGLTSLGGALLIKNAQNAVVGAVAASGAFTDTQDIEIATPGAAPVSTASALPTILLPQALQAVQSALSSSAAAGYWAAAAVLDIGGQLVAYAAMDGTPAAAFDICMKKARVANFVSLAAIAPAFLPASPAYSLQWTNGGMVAYAGGETLVAANGQLLGSIGVWTEGIMDGNVATDNNAAAAAATDVAAGKTVSPAQFTAPVVSGRGGLRMYAGSLITLTQAATTAVTALNGQATVAVRDARGELKFVARGDGNNFGTTDIAIKTSRQSYLFPHSSEHLREAINPSTGVMSTAEMSNGLLTVLYGGWPLTNSADMLVGSLGVSIGNGLQDPVANRALAMSASMAFDNAGGRSAGVNTMTEESMTSYKTGFIVVLIFMILAIFVALGLFLCNRGNQSSGARREDGQAYTHM